MRIVSAFNPRYSNESCTTIDCTVKFDTGEIYPYTAVEHDSTDYGVKLYQDLITGIYGNIKQYGVK